MSSRDIINRFMLEQVMSGKIEKDMAYLILKEINQKQEQDHDIAVIGAACRLPGAKDKDEFWDNLKNGVCSIGRFPDTRRKDMDILLPEEMKKGKDPYTLGGYLDEIDKFDAAFFRLSPKEASYMEPNQKLLLEVAWEAIEDAGYSQDKLYGTEVGVFTGIDHSKKFNYKGLIDEVGILAETGSWASLLSSRISYIMNLRGPSLVIDTACSSGLVALHMARESIKKRECRVAVVSGINLLGIPINRFEGLESTDGRVRAFDKHASGTLWAEGAVSLLIKPLKEALEDGDNIYAVIKGSAINNDGATNGITAPKAETQAEVIVSAWEDAKVDPQTISYIEAHGTGTVLGDPIEVKGIKLAFEKYTDKKQFCGLGSVKTNIGHTVGASGLVSLLKVILAMNKKQIPPSLNFVEPNPFIDFNNTPVFVNDSLIKWETDNLPLRAGVNALGFSRTNCHVVLEQSPDITKKVRPENQRPLVFTVSARKISLLKEYILRYKRYFDNANIDEIDIEDICYTANTGRGQYNCRLAMIVRDKHDLIKKIGILSKLDIERCAIQDVLYKEHSVVADNKASRQPGEITKNEKRELDKKAAEKIKGWAASENDREEVLREICAFYIDGADIRWEELYTDGGYKRLSLPTYPFERKRHWVELENISRPEETPQKDIDHPLLDKLLARTMNEGIFLTEFDVEKHWVLSEHILAGKNIIPGTACLEMALHASKEYYKRDAVELRDVQFIRPIIVEDGPVKVHTILKSENGSTYFKIVSCLNEGDMANGEEWIVHATGEVASGEKQEPPWYGSIQELQDACEIEIEDCSSVINQYNFTSFGTRWQTLKRMRSGKRKAIGYFELPSGLAGEAEKFTTHPALLDAATGLIAYQRNHGDNCYLPFSYRKIKIYKPIPAKFYSYSRLDPDGINNESIKGDITLLDEDGYTILAIEDYIMKRVNNLSRSVQSMLGKRSLYYQIEWRPQEITAGNPGIQEACIVVFTDTKGYGAKIIEELSKTPAEVIEVSFGAHFEKTGHNKYTISGTENDYCKLFEALKVKAFTKIVHLSSITELSEIKSPADLQYETNRGIYSLYRLTRALIRNRIKNDMDLVLVSDYAYPVTKSEARINPQNAAFLSMGKVIGKEHANLKFRCIDIDENTPVSAIMDEIKNTGQTSYGAYRDCVRYTEELTGLDIENVPSSKVDIKENGVYLITGGTGGLGLELAKYLADHGKVNLALINRTALPPVEAWDRILEKEQDRKLCSQIMNIRAIEEKGSSVFCYTADVSKFDEIRDTINRIRQSHGRINGVIHAAGVAGNGFIARKEDEAFSKVLSPKIEGTWILDKLTEEDELDFFVMFSSVVSFMGLPGQGDYTAANTYLDSFAAYRSLKGRKALTIDWTAWKETGMAVDHDANHDNYVFKPITTEQAIHAFREILNKDVQKAIVGELNDEALNIDEFREIPLRISSGIAARARNPVKPSAANKPTRKNVILKGREDRDYSELERKLSVLWADNLGVEELSIYDNFYELGGDSIQATKLANDINKQMHISLDMSDIFEYLTINDLAEYLEKKENRQEAPIQEYSSVLKNDDEAAYDLFHSQERIWFLQKFDPNMVAYNIPTGFYINEEMDLELIQRAMDAITERHGSLRTIFKQVDGLPKQFVREKFHKKIEYIDLSGQENNIEKLEKAILQDNRTVFDLENTLFMAKLYKLSHKNYYLYLNFHHIIVDGWSINIICSELLHAYYAYLSGKEAEWPLLKTNYIDHIYRQRQWIKSDECKAMEGFWLKELEKPLPVLNLPVDYIRPQIQTYNGSYVKYTINKGYTSKLKESSKRLGSTLYTLFLTAYFALLNKITGDDDIIIGTPIAGRNDKNTENIVGLLMNTICIRSGITQSATFRDLLENIKAKCLQAFKNSRYPFDLLVSRLNPERDLGRSPVFSTMFQFYENIPRENESISQYELSLLCREIENEIEVRFEYNTDILKKESVERFLGYFKNILDVIQEQPDISLSELELLSPDEKVRLIESFSNEKAEAEDCLTMHRLFELQAEKSPDTTALIYGSKSITYRELNEKANRVARLIRGEGVKPDQPVGIMVQRGLHTLVGILGILKAGAAYIPIDPMYPPARVSYMLKHSEAGILVTEDALLDRMEVLLEDGVRVETIVNLTGRGQKEIKGIRRLYSLDDIEKQEKGNPEAVATAEDLMYIIYTSGSTGLPKGVMVTHKNAVNYINWSIKDSCLTDNDRMMLVTSISFDISVFEMFGALTSGASLVIVPESSLRDPELLLDCIEHNRVSLWHSVPVLMAQILMAIGKRKNRDDIKARLNLRRIMIGGEAWSVELAKEIREVFSNADIVNMYGPTESTIWVTSYKIGEELDTLTSIPIGRPVSGNSVLILDSNRKLCGIGIEGDIYICGSNVTRGYYRDEAKTREVFIYDEAIGSFLYKTGDRGRYLENGNVEYTGRKDGMVKVRGYRIEVGEIESVLLAEENMEQAAVIAKKTSDTNELVCFYVSKTEYTLDYLRSAIESRLPAYMVPSSFVPLEAMPLTPNGKIDRKALELIEITDRLGTGSEFSEPVSDVEKTLEKIWKELLGLDRVGVNDNFFSLGGNSYLVTRMHTAIDMEYPDKTKVVDLFKYPTISKLAQYINDACMVNEDRDRNKDNVDEKIMNLFDNMQNGKISVEDMVNNLEKMKG